MYHVHLMKSQYGSRCVGLILMCIRSRTLYSSPPPSTGVRRVQPPTYHIRKSRCVTYILTIGDLQPGSNSKHISKSTVKVFKNHISTKNTLAVKSSSQELEGLCEKEVKSKWAANCKACVVLLLLENIITIQAIRH